jgi:hypothetical protein
MSLPPLRALVDLTAAEGASGIHVFAFAREPSRPKEAKSNVSKFKAERMRRRLLDHPGM